LVGVFTGKQAFAVFKIDEKTQRGVALGDDVIKGTKLAEVEADHVVLEHNGMRQQLNLENKAGKNKDNLILEQHPTSIGVDQAVTGWNQAHQTMQKERTQMRLEKTKEVHQ
jgi:type II secretory pathway component PulC